MNNKIELTTCEDCGDSYSTVGWVSDECPFCKCSELETDRDLMAQELKDMAQELKDVLKGIAQEFGRGSGV